MKKLLLLSIFALTPYSALQSMEKPKLKRLTVYTIPGQNGAGSSDEYVRSVLDLMI